MITMFGRNLSVRLLRLLRSQEGTAALEMAFAVPVFALVILGVMEVGRLMWAQSALNYSVEKGARCMLVNAASATTTPCPNPTTVAAEASGFGFAPSIFTASTPACGNQMTASYNFSFMTYVMNYPITLTATACM